ncbi:OmpH family outer membrane protein [Marinimicrobium alkaliphilum]|uniref:OmpH family outer membrane protein n=1 Tax=Marinimicrobium alkaliphilum TaxID=2202654 RepID=UPI000DB9B1AC|nr:OmpH family outer membrane protein [Marinimicrobium alkaliphilum]
MSMIIKKLMAAAVLMLMTGAALADNGKVVVLDLQAAILSSSAAQQSFARLEQNAEYRAMIARLEEIRTELEELQQTAERDGMTWSEEQRASNNRRANYLRSDFEQEAQKVQAERQEVGQRVVQNLAPRVNQILDELMEAENIGVVLNSQGVFRATDTADITDKVTELLNKAD